MTYLQFSCSWATSGTFFCFLQWMRDIFVAVLLTSALDRISKIGFALDDFRKKKRIQHR